LDPLGKGNGSTHSRQNKAQAKSANHQTKAQKPQRAPPAHMQAPPEPMQARHHLKQGSCNNSAFIGQTGHHHQSDRCSTCAQDQHSDRSDQWPRSVRPVHSRAQKWLETTWKPSKCIQQAISSSNFSPFSTMDESSQKMQNF
jgi:hypothetical protein